MISKYKLKNYHKTEIVKEKYKIILAKSNIGFHKNKLKEIERRKNEKTNQKIKT